MYYNIRNEQNNTTKERKFSIMTKTQIFAIIKEANSTVDEMEKVKTDSKEYSLLSESLYGTLDALTDCKNCNLHLSKKGRYYVTF